MPRRGYEASARFREAVGQVGVEVVLGDPVRLAAIGERCIGQRAAEAAERLRQAEARLDEMEARTKASEEAKAKAGDQVEGVKPLGTFNMVKRKVTQLAGLYIEMRVHERDIGDILASRTAEVAFASRPEEKFALAITRIEPSATVTRPIWVRGRRLTSSGSISS